MITGWEDFSESLRQAYGSDFLVDFIATLRESQRAEEEMTFRRQARIKAATSRLDNAWLDGLGECHMSLDPEVFFHWARKEGRQCWNDSQFVREFKRDNPEVIRKARSRKRAVVRP
jgi:hypothetical protein